MKSHLTPLALGLACTLAACAGNGAPATGAPLVKNETLPSLQSGKAPQGRCNAQPLQAWLGQSYGSDTLARALAAAGADEARMLRPDSAITKELQPGRLNVVVDADNRISRVYCG